MSVHDLLVLPGKALYRRAVAWFQLVLFGLLLANNTFFQHVHHLPNGQVIVHAHPFPKGKLQHQHSAHEYQLLDALFHAVYLPVAAIYFTGVFRTPWPIVRFEASLPVPFIFLFRKFLRGPPVLNALPVR